MRVITTQCKRWGLVARRERLRLRLRRLRDETGAVRRVIGADDILAGWVAASGVAQVVVAPNRSPLHNWRLEVRHSGITSIRLVPEDHEFGGTFGFKAGQLDDTWHPGWRPRRHDLDRALRK